MTAINKNEFSFKLPEMLSYHSTWDDADYEPMLPRRRASWPSQVTVAPMRLVTELAERHRVMNELGGFPIATWPIWGSPGTTYRACSTRLSRRTRRPGKPAGLITVRHAASPLQPPRRETPA